MTTLMCGCAWCVYGNVSPQTAQQPDQSFIIDNRGPRRRDVLNQPIENGICIGWLLTSINDGIVFLMKRVRVPGAFVKLWSFGYVVLQAEIIC